MIRLVAQPRPVALHLWAAMPRLSALPLLVVPTLILLVAVGCGDGGESWTWLEAARGHLADPVDLRAAEALANEAQASGGARAAYGEFIRGNIAFTRSEVTEREALKPNADPLLLQRTIADAEDALASWRLAAASRDDWPEGRRNVERAILRVERLRERASEKTKPKVRPRPRPDAPPPPPGQPPPQPDPTQDPTIDLRKDDLPAGKVLGLLELLKQKERKKMELRQARRHARGTQVERDW